MKPIVLIIIWLVAVGIYIFLIVRDNRKLKRENEKTDKIFKAMGEADKYAKPFTPKHAKKTVELFEKEERKKQAGGSRKGAKKEK